MRTLRGPAVGVRTLTALSMTVWLAAVNAQPQHDCVRPDKPEQFESEDARAEFFAEAQEYLDCLTAFYEEQAEASRLAAEAANAAREEAEEFAAEVQN